MLRTILATLAALWLLAAAAPGAPAQVPLPLPVNGDFSLGTVNWGPEGLAAIGGGVARIGQPDCYGAEPAGVIGDISTVLGQPTLRASMAYDYRVTTSDGLAGDGLRVVVIDPLTGVRDAVDVFNPNHAQGVCGTFTGHRQVPLPNPLPAYARLEFHVWGDATGDRFLAEIDNVRLVVG